MSNIISITHTARFTYDARGRGIFEFIINGLTLREEARTGSINGQGQLINALPPCEYSFNTAPEKPTPEEYDLMHVKNCPGAAFKWRLYNPNYTHYHFHPDGSKAHAHDGNGTLGCIGGKTNAEEIKLEADKFFILNKGHIIRCIVKADFITNLNQLAA